MNINVNVNASLPYNNSYQQHHQYVDRNMRNDRTMAEKMHQQQYRNNTNHMDSLVEATSNLNLLSNARPEEPRGYQHSEQQYPKPYAPSQNVQDIPPFRRNNDMPKYQEQSYQRRPANGYMEAQQSALYPGVGYMGGAGGAGYSGRQVYGYGRELGARGGVRGAAGGGPFLPGSLLGFQNAAVNEQARAMLGVADIHWKVGDRCLALYWEDNNVSIIILKKLLSAKFFVVNLAIIFFFSSFFFRINVFFER